MIWRCARNVQSFILFIFILLDTPCVLSIALKRFYNKRGFEYENNAVA